MNASIIGLGNQKGGTGKPTTCVNLGIDLAREGKKVLIADCDPQGSATISLGHSQPDTLPVTLTDLMGKVLNDEPISPEEGILHHEEGVNILPANMTLAGMEVSLVNAMSRETTLKQVLANYSKEYDHILLDCGPSLGMLTINALAAADRIIIPVQAQYLSAKGVEQLLATTKENQSLDDIEFSDKSETRKMIEKFVDENPEAAANLLRNWLNEDWG